MFEHKGYVGVARYEPELEAFAGEVVDIRDVVTFEGVSVEELRGAFEEAVDEYLRFCEELGQKPGKPYSGNMLVRGNSEIHRELSVIAATEGVSVNALILSILEKEVVRRHA